MRILQVHNAYLNYGGEDAVVENEYNLLFQRGHEIKRINYTNERVSARKLFFNKDTYEEISREIQEFRPEVMHVHNLFYYASPSILKAAKDQGVPVVMTLHNFRLLCPAALFLRDNKTCTKCKDLVVPFWGAVHKCFQDSAAKSIVLSAFLGYQKMTGAWDRYVDKFVVLTPFIKELFVNSSLGIDAQKFVVKPNSTNDLWVASKQDLDGTDFLFIGRLSQEKGIDFLVNAFKKMPEYSLDVIGTGDLQPQLEVDASSNVRFHGHQEKPFIEKKLRQVKAMIFPSRCYEGLPNTIIEAYSAGTPVLAADIDNVNQIVQEGVHGKLFDLNDEQGFIDMVHLFVKSNTNHYQANVRRTFEEKYTHDANYKKLMEIYRTLI